MKELFKEKVQEAKTPDQSAMKGLFKDHTAAEMSTPNQDAMKKLFKHSTSSSPVLEKTVLEGVFTEKVADETAFKEDMDEESTQKPKDSTKSIFSDMAEKSFSHYTTPSKKSPFEQCDIVSVLLF